MVKNTANVIGRVRSSAFLRHNAIYFFGSLAASAINYLYYPVLGHLLKLADYGEVQALVALSLQMAIFITVLSQVTVNVAATYNEMDKRRVAFELEKLALFISLLVFIVGSIFSWKLRDFFNFSSIWPFIVLLVMLVVTGPSSFRAAYLNGHKKFGITALYNILIAASRLVFSVLFVLIGWGAIGAIFGLVIAQILAFIYTAYQAQKLGFGDVPGLKYLSMPDLRLVLPELKYGLFVFASSMGITLMSSMDIFVVKHYFDVTTAGRYAGVSAVARILFILTAPIAQVLLPSVRKTRPARENYNYLIRSLALLTGIGGVVLLGFTLLPHFVIGVLMGGNYTPYSNLLPMLSLAMFMMSVLNLIIYYHIALRHYQMCVIVIAGMVVTATLMALSHSSLLLIIHNLVWGSVAMLGLFLAWGSWRAVQAERS
jgi:O-antigen/teichoic acid export membrane protein